MNRKIIIYLLLICLIGLVLKTGLTEHFTTGSNIKKSILITGIRSQIIGESVRKQFQNQYNLFCLIEPEEPKLYELEYITGLVDEKNLTGTINQISKYGPFDIIINNLHDPKQVSRSILNVSHNLNIKSNIKLLDGILQYVNPYGKIINFMTNLEEFSGSKVLDWDIGYFIKSKSVESYKNKIALGTIKFPELSNGHSEFYSVMDFILNNQWVVLAGRQFNSNKIYGKLPGYMFELAELAESDSNSLANNFANDSELVSPALSLKQNQIHVNKLQEKIFGKLNIIWFKNTQEFLTEIIKKFVPVKHHIILINLFKYNFIPTDRAVTANTIKIQNNQVVPDYDKIMDKINSLTRLIVFSGSVEQTQFEKFISQVPENILIIVDTTWNNFTADNQANQPIQTYKLKGTNRCYKKSISRTIKPDQLIKYSNIITINNLSQVLQLNDTSIGYACASLEMSKLISSTNGSKLANDADILNMLKKLEAGEIDKVKQYCLSQLEIFIGLLDSTGVKFQVVNPVTIKIFLKKSDKNNLNNVMRNITNSNANFIQVIKTPDVNEVFLYISLNKLSNEQNIQLVKSIQV